MDVFLVGRKVLSQSQSLYDEVGKVFWNVRSNVVFLENCCDLLACNELGIRDSVTVS